MAMRTIVCVKQVVDPETPPESFKVDAANNKMVLPTSAAQVISPFDEQAVEGALRIKDALGGKVTVLSMGVGLLKEVLKKTLAQGADELVMLDDPAFAGGDSWSTAFALASAIKKMGAFDLIFCGRQASDWDSGQVGTGIAEILGLPSVTIARKVEVADGKARVERVVPDGYEVIEVPLPALVTTSNELGTLRYPNIKGIMAAKKIDPIMWKLADIGLAPAQVGAAGRRSRMLKLFQPVRDAKCEIVAADSPEEAGVMLAVRLREAKIL